MAMARFGRGAFLADDDLSYLGFFLAACQVWDWASRVTGRELVEGEPYGYLTRLPLLRGVPYEAQVDLLARTWARHYAPVAREGSLLDAAVTYAAFEDTAELILDQPDLVEELLREYAVRDGLLPTRRTAQQLRSRFRAWWGGEFPLASQPDGFSPEAVARLGERLGVGDRAAAPLVAALGQYRATPWLGTNLQGLLCREDIQFVCWNAGLDVPDEQEEWLQ